MARDGCNFYFSFWAILSHSTSLTAWKTEIKKNNKKEILEISSFYISVWKTMIICYNVPEIWHLMDVTFIFSFCAIFCTSTPLKAQKTKSQKKRKKHLEISSFYTNIPKIMIICYNVPEIWRLANANFILHLGPFCVLFPPSTPVLPPSRSLSSPP